MRKITPLKEKFNALPKSVSFEKNILPVLEANDIARATFYRDLKSPGESIPTGRLKIYAKLFSCDLDDLVQSYDKIKPLVKNSLVKKSGLVGPRLGIFLIFSFLTFGCITSTGRYYNFVQPRNLVILDKRFVPGFDANRDSYLLKVISYQDGGYEYKWLQTTHDHYASMHIGDTLKTVLIYTKL